MPPPAAPTGGDGRAPRRRARPAPRARRHRRRRAARRRRRARGGAGRGARAGPASSGRRTVLVVDGVDQLDDVDGAPDLAWLPRSLPAGRAASCSPPAPAGRSSRRRTAAGRCCEVPPLDADERRALIATFLARFAKGLDEVHLDRLAARRRPATRSSCGSCSTSCASTATTSRSATLIDRLLGGRRPSTICSSWCSPRYERDFERDRPGLVRDAFTRAVGGPPGPHRGRAARRARRRLTSRCRTRSGRRCSSPPRTGSSPARACSASPPSTTARRSRTATSPTDADRQRPTPCSPPYFAAPAARAAACRRAAVAAARRRRRRRAGRATLGDLEFTRPRLPALAPRPAPAVGAAEAAGRRHGRRLPPGVVDDPASATPTSRVGGRPAAHRRRLPGRGARPAPVPGRRRAPARRTSAPAAGRARQPRRRACGCRATSRAAEPALAEAADRAAPPATPILQAAVGNLAMVRRDRGDLDGAVPLFEEDERICRELGDDRRVCRQSLGNHAQLLRQLGDTRRRARPDRRAGAAVPRSPATAPASPARWPGRRRCSATAATSPARCRCLRVHDGDVPRARRPAGLAEGLLNQAVDAAPSSATWRAQGAAAEAEAHRPPARRPRAARPHPRWPRPRPPSAAGQWADAERLAREAELTAREVDAPAQVAAGPRPASASARREQGDLAGCRGRRTRSRSGSRASWATPARWRSRVSNLGRRRHRREPAGRRAGARTPQAEPVFRRARDVTEPAPLLANRGAGPPAPRRRRPRASPTYATARRLGRVQLGQPSAQRSC